MHKAQPLVGQQSEGCGVRILHTRIEELDELLTGVSLIEESSVQQVQNNDRNPARLLANGGKVGEGERVGSRSLERARGCGNFLEMGNRAWVAVFFYYEIRLLEPGQVLARFVGNDYGDGHELGAGGEGDLGRRRRFGGVRSGRLLGERLHGHEKNSRNQSKRDGERHKPAFSRACDEQVYPPRNRRQNWLVAP